MEKNEIVSALEPVITAFNELGILYYIGGSVASSVYGTARATLDIDLVSNLTALHIQPLIEKLKKLYYIDAEMISDALNNKSSFNILHLESMLKIDVFILKNSPYSIKSFERRLLDKLDESPDTVSIYLCSPEDIIINKLEWYKSGGKISERQWLDILGVIKVQGENLDKTYLIYWARQLELVDLLSTAFSECGSVL